MISRLKKDTLFFRLSIIVISGTVAVSVLVTLILLNITEGIFVKTFTDTQAQAMEQIVEDFNSLHGDILSVSNTVRNSWAFRLYLTEEEMSTKESFQVAYQLVKHLNRDIPSRGFEEISTLILGKNGATHLTRSDILNISTADLLQEELSQRAFQDPNRIIYSYAPSGFTSFTKDSPVITAAKALSSPLGGNNYGIVYFTLKEEVLRNYYSYMTGSTTTIYLMDKEGRVMSSNNEAALGELVPELQEAAAAFQDGQVTTLEKNDSSKNNETLVGSYLPYFDAYLMAVIDDGIVAQEIYNTPDIVLTSFFVSMIIIVVVFLVLKNSTDPLSLLVEKMSMVKKGDLSHTIEVSGPSEVRELTESYNTMVVALQDHVDEIIKIQKEKRRAEIAALQLQINPHYIYNTLTSIKLLIWEGENEKSIKALDSFIVLLQNTISKVSEYITLKEELDNIKSYVYINQMRFGSGIRVNFYAPEEAMSCLVPKLILQPLVENSFFHGFNGRTSGNINIFAALRGDWLQIEIMDDGNGITAEKLQEILRGQEDDKRHFSSIGIANTDARLKLIYGEDASLSITSEYQKGTTVILKLPVNHSKNVVQKEEL